jgi:hypothetical protein
MLKPISLHLASGRTVWIEVDSKEWTAAFEQALQSNSVLHIDNPKGGKDARDKSPDDCLLESRAPLARRLTNFQIGGGTPFAAPWVLTSWFCGLQLLGEARSCNDGASGSRSGSIHPENLPATIRP